MRHVVLNSALGAEDCAQSFLGLLDLQAYYTGGKGGDIDDVVSTILARPPAAMDQFLAEFANNFVAKTGAA